MGMAGPVSECLVIATAVALHLLAVLSLPVATYAFLWPSISRWVNLLSLEVTDGGRVLRYLAQRPFYEVNV